MTELWPWLALAGLGMFHGLNPAMGWLFAVALGLHRRSRGVVVLALAPIALGHALSIWIVAAVVVALGVAIDPQVFRVAASVILLGAAAFHWFYGHRHRIRVGMTTGLAGLVAWSFLMASAHGAGLMLVPALLPLCVGPSAIGAGSIWIAAAAAGVHTLAMLLVTGGIALAVFDWLGLGLLRRGWINFDLLWTVMLVGGAALLILT